MADPKYAGLPGIVYDQPDIYETSDLPDSDLDLDYIETDDTSSTVEILHISGLNAHEKFAGKFLDSTKVDFSDKISHRSQKGYTTRGIEWEIGGENESVVQKYQRLQCEINNLQQDVQQMKGDIDHCGGKVSAVELNEQVQCLHSIVSDMNLEEVLGKETLTCVSKPEINLQQKIIDLLENFKNSESPTAMPLKSDAGQQDSNVKYELCYAPNHAKLNQSAAASHLEKRLDKLETLIGNNPEKLSSLSTWTNHKSLLGASQILCSRLSLLDPAHLDHIDGRLHAVHTKMNTLAEKRAIIDEANSQSKVTELYELMKKCDNLSSDFPEVVARLISVEDLNREATQFGRSMKQLDSAQTQLKANLEANGISMTEVQKRFMENLAVIQKNISSLEQRVQKLPKK